MSLQILTNEGRFEGSVDGVLGLVQKMRVTWQRHPPPLRLGGECLENFVRVSARNIL